MIGTYMNLRRRFGCFRVAATATLLVAPAACGDDGGAPSTGSGNTASSTTAGTTATGTTTTATASGSTTGPGTGTTYATGAGSSGGSTGTTGSGPVGNAVAIALGVNHTCARIDTGDVMCWGDGIGGKLGYGDTQNVGDDEAPVAWGTIDVGAAVSQVTAGLRHTCAIIDGGAVKCWGTGSFGRLGYANTDNVGDDETPASVATVDVGGTVVQVAAGGSHTCALLQDGSVRCWGDGDSGLLGYGNTNTIGDDETPASVGPLDLGGPAIAIAAGLQHTCAILQSGGLVCWGYNGNGRLGYGHTNNIGDDETPASQGTVNVGGPVTQVAVGANHTCALLQDGRVRCWGYNGNGALGYGNTVDIGDDEAPATVNPVDIGDPAVAIAAGGGHTCVILQSGGVRCWGYNGEGQLGYGHTDNIGDDETPASAGPVDVGPGTVVQLAAGGGHTCVLLDDGKIRCWGENSLGQLGYGHTNRIGDDETPASAGDVPYK